MARDGRRVVLAVRSDSFAGVERYLCDAANELNHRGWHVAVIGGEERAMRDQLGSGIAFTAAATTASVATALTRRPRADVVHVHMTAAEVAATIALPFTRRRFVTTRHFAGRRGNSLLARSAAPVLRAAAAQQISISAFVAESLHEASLVIHNGVRSRPQAQLNARVVTMMQRLEPEKDPLTGLRAWAASGLGRQGWRLKIAGRGHLGPAVLRAAEHLSVADSVDVLGFVHDTAGLLEGSSIFLAPALEEPFGLSVIEAMACGLPVVASAAGAHRETVVRDDLLFPAGDYTACADVLRHLAADVGVRRAVGEALRARQQQEFDVAVHVDRLEQVYLSTLSRGDSPA